MTDPKRIQAHWDLATDLRKRGMTGIATLSAHRALAQSLDIMDDMDSMMALLNRASATQADMSDLLSSDPNENKNAITTHTQDTNADSDRETGHNDA